MDVKELESLSIDKLVDARGTACPGPLLEAKRAMTGGLQTRCDGSAVLRSEYKPGYSTVGEKNWT